MHVCQASIGRLLQVLGGAVNITWSPFPEEEVYIEGLAVLMSVEVSTSSSSAGTISSLPRVLKALVNSLQVEVMAMGEGSW